MDGRRVVGPCDGVAGVLLVLDAGIAQQFPDYAGVAHSPPGARGQRAGVGPVLVIAPACAQRVDGDPVAQVCGEDVGEGQFVTYPGTPSQGLTIRAGVRHTGSISSQPNGPSIVCTCWVLSRSGTRPRAEGGLYPTRTPGGSQASWPGSEDSATAAHIENEAVSNR
jgi:hypothetical protein